MGGCQVLLFDDGEHPHPTREVETVHVWKLLLQERDTPQRQAQPQRTDHGRDRAGRYDPAPQQRRDQRARAQAAGRAIAGERDWVPEPLPDCGDQIPW
jgi:hypothetical protein